jgi:hypothetical protein
MLAFQEAREANLFWKPSPTEQQVSSYFVAVSKQPRIYRPEENPPYVYDSIHETTIPYIRVTNLEENQIYYFVVFANRENVWSPPSKEVKITPNRLIQASGSLENDPILNVLAFKYSIFGDSGKYVAIENSADLINWTQKQNVIIDSNDRIDVYFSLTGGFGFFRARPITELNYLQHDPTLFDYANGFTASMRTIEPQTSFEQNLDAAFGPLIIDETANTFSTYKKPDLSKNKRPKKDRPQKKN